MKFFFCRLATAAVLFTTFGFTPILLLPIAISIFGPIMCIAVFAFAFVNSRNNFFVKFMIVFGVLFVITIECFIILGAALASFFLVPSYVFFAIWYFYPWLYFCLLPKTTKLIIPKNDVFQFFSKIEKKTYYSFNNRARLELGYNFSLFSCGHLSILDFRSSFGMKNGSYRLSFYYFNTSNSLMI